GLQLPGPPQPLQGHRPERVEQHGLPDAAQPGEHHAPLGPGAGDALQHDLKLAYLPVPPGELGRALTGTRGIGASYGVHDRTLWSPLARTVDFRRHRYRRVAAVLPHGGYPALNFLPPKTLGGLPPSPVPPPGHLPPPAPPLPARHPLTCEPPPLRPPFEPRH